jgi:hypothetical protein
VGLACSTCINSSYAVCCGVTCLRVSLPGSAHNPVRRVELLYMKKMTLNNNWC